ncbi:acetylhydrolase IB subunit beta [Acrasis kona]|uniref:Acetylhydrolase IB subunit beta n=1 Tax=Acrasis kona TaxID=1008807 RepID=A0AAW2ZBB2_9EUKA
MNNCCVASTRERTEKTHANHLKEIEQMGDFDEVFVGDSITENFKYFEQESLWLDYTFGKKVLNAGVGGDKTSNVLWRLQNGLFDNIRPSKVSLMIGTNNIEKDNPVAITEAIKLIIEHIHNAVPNAKIKVYAVLPRSVTNPKKDNNIMKKVCSLNKQVQEMLQVNFQSFTEFIDMSASFAQGADYEELNQNLYFDHVHLNASGYSVWHKFLKESG